MKFTFTEQFKKDKKKLQLENPKINSKLWDLIFSIDENFNNPLGGIGKPERLKGNLSNCYSRRITDKHRLIYEYYDNVVILISCYGHYTDK